MSLDETWAALPALEKLCDELREWGIYDPTLSEKQLKERWVRFHGVKFGVAPPGAWPELRRSLLEFEPMLAVRQQDVGLVAGYPFDPCVPEDTFVIPQPYPYEPGKRTWLKREM